MATSKHADASPESYQRSSPLAIISYLSRGFAIANPANLIGVLLKSSGGAVLALYVFSGLQSIDIHWFLRVLVLGVCVLAVQLAISVFKYFTLQFRYDENKISAKKGFGTQAILDFDWFSVRSIVVTRSVLQRGLDLASVSLVTAGSSENTIEIPYIPYSIAIDWEKRVKDHAVQTDNRAQQASPTDRASIYNEVSDEEQTRERIHKLTPRKLVQASIAGGNILIDALYGFFVVGVGYFLYRFIYQILFLAPSIFEFEDPGPVQLLRSQVSSTIRDLPTSVGTDTTSLIETFQQFTGVDIAQSTQGKILFFISLALILSVLFYVINRIRYITWNYGFELTRRGIHLQAENGLLSKRRLTIRRDRVQTTLFRTNFVERSINRGDILLDSASKFNSSIPFVTTECADRILRIVTDDERTPVTVSPFSQQFTSIHVLSFIQSLVIQVVLFLPIPLVLIATFFPATRGLIWPYSLLLIGYAILRIYVRWRQEGYVINKDFLLKKEGGFSWWSVKVAPLNKVQSMSITQSWIQRLRNRATIIFNFASGTQPIPFLSLSVAEAMQRTVEGRIRGDSNVLHGEDEAGKTWRSLPNKYIVSRVIGKSLTSVLVLAPLLLLIAWGIYSWFSVSFELLAWIVPFVWGALVVWRVVVVCLKVPKYRYMCGNDDIVVKESFLGTKAETVRYSRLQSVSTHNNLTEGFFGLCSLTLYTAEDEVTIRGLDQREASRLREHIATRMLEISSTGSDALSMTEEDSTLVDSEPTHTTQDETTELGASTYGNAIPHRAINANPTIIVVPINLFLVELTE